MAKITDEDKADDLYKWPFSIGRKTMTDEELQALNEARQCAIAMRKVLKEAGLERAFSHRFYELFDRAKRDARDVFCGTCNKHFEPERGTGIYVGENGEFVCPSCRREEIVTNANG